MTKAEKAKVREAARQDYLEGMSYRQIAARYGISVGLIAKWAKADVWEQEGLSAELVAKREQKRERRREQNEQREQPNPAEGAIPFTELVDEELPDYTSLRATALLILAKINQRLLAEKPLEPRDIKSLTGALLDLKNQLNALSPRELREQAARLRSLEKQAQADDKPQEPVQVVFVNREWDNANT